MKKTALLFGWMLGVYIVAHAQSTSFKSFAVGYSVTGFPVQFTNDSLSKPDYLDSSSFVLNTGTGNMMMHLSNSQYSSWKIMSLHKPGYQRMGRFIQNSPSIEQNIKSEKAILYRRDDCAALGFFLPIFPVSVRSGYYLGSMFKWVKPPDIKLTSQKTFVCTSNKGWKKVMGITFSLPVKGYTLPGN